MILYNVTYNKIMIVCTDYNQLILVTMSYYCEKRIKIKEYSLTEVRFLLYIISLLHRRTRIIISHGY